MGFLLLQGDKSLASHGQAVSLVWKTREGHAILLVLSNAGGRASSTIGCPVKTNLTERRSHCHRPNTPRDALWWISLLVWRHGLCRIGIKAMPVARLECRIVVLFVRAIGCIERQFEPASVFHIVIARRQGVPIFVFKPIGTRIELIVWWRFTSRPPIVVDERRGGSPAGLRFRFAIASCSCRVASHPSRHRSWKKV